MQRLRWRQHSPRWNVRLIAAVFGLWCAFETIPAAAEESPSRVANEVHARGRYPSDLSVMPSQEIELETGDGGVEQRDPQRRRPVHLYRSGGSDAAPEPVDNPFRFPDLSGIGAVLGYVLIAFCVLALLGALVYGLSRLRLPTSQIDAEDPRAAPHTEGAVLDPLLVAPEMSAEDLARLGRYREAIHALLVSGLLATGFRPEGRARGTTAREVVRALESTDARKAPLSSLLESTELVWFGGREATAETYENARGMYASVAREQTR